MLYVMRINPQNLVISESDAKGRFVVRGLDYYDTAKFTIQGIDDKGKLFGRAVRQSVRTDHPAGARTNPNASSVTGNYPTFVIGI